MKAAPANRPAPTPPALTLIFSSDLASSISLRTRVETSRLASATRRPIVGSSLLGTAVRSMGWVEGCVAHAMPPWCPERTGARNRAQRPRR